MKTTDFRQRFLTNRDESGRFIVTSFRTGKSYFVEPIGPDRMADWGSVNPATGDMENKKGAGKFRGAIDEKESMITEANGFKKEDIHYTGIGGSPFSLIDELDSKYPTKSK